MATIAATTPPLAVAAAAACGGVTTGTSSTSGSGGDDATGLGSSGSSGNGASSGASGTCQGIPPITEHVPYRAPSCDGGASGDAGGVGGDSCESQYQLCQRLCTQSPTRAIPTCYVVDVDGGEKTVTCETAGHPCGRRHEGLAPMQDEHASPVAQWLVEAAYLEDASVSSFEILARELAAHGAPERLVRAAEESARDEVRHARMMSSLAQRHGGRPRRASKPDRATRELLPMVIENAVEGCVNETYGALLAWYQSQHATDPKMRAAMTQIADDETRHAALAWQIAAWAEPRLDVEARESVRTARARALDALESSLGAEPSATVAAAVGLPAPAAARDMLKRLVAALSGDEPPAV